MVWYSYPIEIEGLKGYKIFYGDDPNVIRVIDPTGKKINLNLSDEWECGEEWEEKVKAELVK